MNYPVVIHKDANSDFGVTVPDLPGCFSAGRTLDDTLAGAKEAIELHIEGLAEAGQAMPPPGSIDTIRRSQTGQVGGLRRGSRVMFAAGHYIGTLSGSACGKNRVYLKTDPVGRQRPYSVIDNWITSLSVGQPCTAIDELHAAVKKTRAELRSVRQTSNARR